jgi:putative endonuclease
MSRLRDFERLPHTHAKGDLAEDAAETHLRAHGYRIVERNVRTKLGEIDLLALDGEVLCFVEVKARLSAEFGHAIEAVGPRKRRRLAKIAALVLARNRSQRACRFDVLGIDRAADGSWTFTLLKDAIQLDRL